LAFVSQKLGLLFAVKEVSILKGKILNKLALSILLGGMVSANANLVINGSFENNGSDMYANNGAWQTYYSITGWSNTYFVEIQNNGLFGAASVAADGTNWLELDSYAGYSISQGLGAIAGQNYSLTFAFAGRPDTNPIDNAFSVIINGAATNYGSGASASGGPLNWQTGTLNFTSNGADVITFNNLGGSNGLGILLDNVIVEAPAVPEPATLGLFGMGLLALMGLGKVRSARKA
jgi:hypothetical protein